MSDHDPYSDCWFQAILVWSVVPLLAAAGELFLLSHPPNQAR